MSIKKVIHWGGARGNGGTVLISSCVITVLVRYPSILLGYPSNIHAFMPSIGSRCVIVNFSIIPFL